MLFCLPEICHMSNQPCVSARCDPIYRLWRVHHACWGLAPATYLDLQLRGVQIVYIYCNQVNTYIGRYKWILIRNRRNSACKFNLAGIQHHLVLRTCLPMTILFVALECPRGVIHVCLLQFQLARSKRACMMYVGEKSTVVLFWKTLQQYIDRMRFISFLAKLKGKK
jgi:hypothetical protein